MAAVPLAGCVSSLQSSITLLTSSIAILDGGVRDFPRLTKVLQAERHFELLPESTLAAAQSSLLATLTPELTSLLSRVETHLDKLARREKALIAKCELQEGRLTSSTTRSKAFSIPRTQGSHRRRPARTAFDAEGEDGDELAGDGRDEADKDDDDDDDDDDEAVKAGREQLRLKQMRQKKERLSYMVDRLTLQAQQKERELRKSVAAQ